MSGGTNGDADGSETDAEMTDEREQSLEDDIVSEQLVTGAVSSGSSSLPDISESEDDPSLPLPVDCCLRDVRRPYRPVLSKYKVTVH